MDIRTLRYFLEVGTLRSFTKASEKLHVVQPALSVAVRKLEDELGVALLVRQSRQVVPTAEGEILLAHVQRVLLEMDSARQAIDDAVELKVGDVRVGLPPMFGLTYLPSLIARFHAAFPGLVVTALEGGADEIAAMLNDGEIDVAVLEARRVHPEWSHIPIGEEELVLCVSVDSPLAGRASLPGAALDGVPMVLFTRPFIQREVVERVCRAAGAKPRVVMQSNFVPLVCQAALDGIGAATLLRSLALSIKGLWPISFDPPEHLSFTLCWRNDRYLSQANRAFIDFAKPKA